MIVSISFPRPFIYCTHEHICLALEATVEAQPRTWLYVLAKLQSTSSP